MLWHVLRTEFQQEQRADKRLLRQRIHTFLPLLNVEHRRKDGLLVTKIKPLFSGYLFVRCIWADSTAILSTRGIQSFIGYRQGMDVAPSVRARDIEELQLRLHQLDSSSRPKEIQPGMMAHILFGPYRDRIAPVQAIHGSRIEVLLSLLGRDVSLCLDRECLTAA